MEINQTFAASLCWAAIKGNLAGSGSLSVLTVDCEPSFSFIIQLDLTEPCSIYMYVPPGSKREQGARDTERK